MQMGHPSWGDTLGTEDGNRLLEHHTPTCCISFVSRQRRTEKSSSHISCKQEVTWPPVIIVCLEGRGSKIMQWLVWPDLIATLGWPTLERRRIIKQAMTFYKILNNIINITPPPGLLKPSKNRGHYIATRCRINTAVFSFYPRAIRIWNMIPPHITAIENPIAFQAAIMNLPFPTPNHLNCL